MQSAGAKQTSLSKSRGDKYADWSPRSPAFGSIDDGHCHILFFSTSAHLQLGSSLVRRSLCIRWCVSVCQSQRPISYLTLGSLSGLRPVFNLRQASNHLPPAMVHTLMPACTPHDSRSYQRRDECRERLLLQSRSCDPRRRATCGTQSSSRPN